MIVQGIARSDTKDIQLKNQSTGASSGAVPVAAIILPAIVPMLPRMQQQMPGAAGAPARTGDIRIPWKSYTDRALRSLGSNDNLVDDIVAPFISQHIRRHGWTGGDVQVQRGYGT